jgi:hypothetical protein
MLYAIVSSLPISSAARSLTIALSADGDLSMTEKFLEQIVLFVFMCKLVLLLISGLHFSLLFKYRVELLVVALLVY